MMKNVVVQDLKEPMKYVEKALNFLRSVRRLSIRRMAVQLNLGKETVKRPELWPNDWILRHNNAPAESNSGPNQKCFQQ
jgi:hypothetical protein